MYWKLCNNKLHQLIYASKCVPSRHETSTQCWIKAGSASTTLAQYLSNIGPMSRLWWKWKTWSNKYNNLNRGNTSQCFFSISNLWEGIINNNLSRMPDNHETLTQCSHTIMPALNNTASMFYVCCVAMSCRCVVLTFRVRPILKGNIFLNW